MIFSLDLLKGNQASHTSTQSLKAFGNLVLEFFFPPQVDWQIFKSMLIYAMVISPVKKPAILGYFSYFGQLLIILPFWTSELLHNLSFNCNFAFRTS